MPFPGFLDFYLSNWLGLIPLRGWPQQLMVDTYAWPMPNKSQAWFLETLLGLQLLFAACTSVAPLPHPLMPPTEHDTFDGRTLWLYTVAAGGAVGVITFLVRIPFPVDHMVGRGLLSQRPARLPHYVAAYALGVAMAQRHWLERIPLATAKQMTGAAAVSVAVMLYVRAVLDNAPDVVAHIKGGLCWESAFFSVLEGVTAACALVGSTKVLIDSHPHRITSWMSANSFGVFILHQAVIVPLQHVLDTLVPAPPAVACFLLVSAVGVSGSNVLTAILRKTPLRRIL